MSDVTKNTFDPVIRNSSRPNVVISFYTRCIFQDIDPENVSSATNELLRSLKVIDNVTFWLDYPRQL